MSLNGIIGNALSGLQAAQLGMRTASNNVANVNTAGYARTEINQTARNAAGQGMGVEIVGIERVTDRYLQAASLRAGSDASAAEVLASTLDRLQAQFGAPDDEGALFGRLNQAFSSLGSAATDSAERVARLSAASDIQTFFDEAQRLSVEIRGMRDEADQRIAAGVERVNEILAEMQALNSEAQALSASVTDTSGTANRQAELMDELSTYMDVRADYQADGRIFVRTGNGTTLLDNSRLELDYTPAGTGAYGIDYGSITAVVSASGAQVDLTPAIQSGQIRGLMDLRDQELPAIAAGLAEFAAGVADGLNAAHNNSSSYPAPNSLAGRQTGLVSSDILTGSGTARVAVVGADGSLVRSVEVQVGAAGFTVDGNAAPLIADLVTQLNTAFAGDATATFTNGQLTITAANGANGIATVQDEADPSSIGGRGFAYFFGLNDIVDAARPGFFDTGLEPGSFHQLTAGGELGFNVFTPDGRRALEVAVPVTGSTIADQIAALNSPTTGIGQYGSFATQMTDSDIGAAIAPAGTGATGYNYPIIAPLLHGGSTVLLERWDGNHPEEAFALIEKHRCTFAVVIPTQLVKMVRSPLAGNYDLGCLRFISNAGAKLAATDAEAAERIFGCPVQTVYGATDSGVPTMTRVTDPAEKRRTAGHVLPGEELKIVRDDGSIAGAGEPGEVVWRGGNSSYGYLTGSAELDKAWDADGWYHSGDLGTLDSEGYLTIVGRKKDMIIRGGRNINPRQIEEILIRHPAVIDAAIVAVSDSVLGEQIGAAIVAAPDKAQPELGELTRFVVDAGLPKWCQPEYLLVFDDFPRNAGGKIDKSQLSVALEKLAAAKRESQS